jgi:hypothetical protein
VLDDDRGCESVVRAIDDALPAKRRLRLGLDASLSGARFECLVRALRRTTLGDPGQARPALRRPRLTFDWLAVVAGETSYPRCVPGSVVPEDYDPKAPSAYRVAVLGPRELSLWSYSGSRKMDPPVPIPADTPPDRVAWPVLEGGGNAASWIAWTPPTRPRASSSPSRRFSSRGRHPRGATPRWRRYSCRASQRPQLGLRESCHRCPKTPS